MVYLSFREIFKDNKKQIISFLVFSFFTVFVFALCVSQAFVLMIVPTNAVAWKYAIIMLPIGCLIMLFTLLFAFRDILNFIIYMIQSYKFEDKVLAEDLDNIIVTSEFNENLKAISSTVIEFQTPDGEVIDNSEYRRGGHFIKVIIPKELSVVMEEEIK